MIAIDWGTTNVRAYLIDETGEVLEKRSAPLGVMATTAGDFTAVLNELVGSWSGADSNPIMMCGMVGSRQGLMEVPYVACPADESDIARGGREVDLGGGRSAFIFPGLICKDVNGVPDVLRGEETQVLGALPALPNETISVWLPGTHSKHLRVRKGVIESFSTHMTGEVFSTLSRHSILERLMAGSAVDLEAFAEGVQRAGDSGGLLHHLFGVRSRALAGELPSAATRSYLSGVLIGHEVVSDPPCKGSPVYLLGEATLSRLYLTALELMGIAGQQAGADHAAAGLFRLRQSIDKGMVS